MDKSNLHKEFPAGTSLGAFPCEITSAAALDKWGGVIDMLHSEFRLFNHKPPLPDENGVTPNAFRSTVEDEPDETPEEKAAYAAEISTWEG